MIELFWIIKRFVFDVFVSRDRRYRYCLDQKDGQTEEAWEEEI